MAKKKPEEYNIETEEQADHGVEFTPEQKLFVIEYLKDFNGRNAAIRAGYSEKTATQTASRLLTYVNVQVALRDAMEQVLGNSKEDIKRIIDELKMIAFSDIKDVVSWDESRKLVDQSTGKTFNTFRTTIRDASEMGDKSRVIAELSESETELSSNRKVKLYDKLRAIELLGKYYKMFTDKIEHTNPDGNMKPQVFVYLPKNSRESDE